MSSNLKRLRAARIETLRRGRGSRPDVQRVRHGAGEAVLKDQNGCDAVFARLFGPLLAWREARSLRRLHGLSGIPELLERPDRRSLLMEYIPATPITRAGDVDWPAFFAALESLVRAMHARGVAHGDLRSPHNTLVACDGQPVLVDFVASVHRGRAFNPPGRWLFTRLSRVDELALIKLKSLVAPQLLAAGERPLLEHRGVLARATRRLGMALRGLARGLFTRRE